MTPAPGTMTTLFGEAVEDITAIVLEGPVTYAVEPGSIVVEPASDPLVHFKAGADYKGINVHTSSSRIIAVITANK